MLGPLIAIAGSPRLRDETGKPKTDEATLAHERRVRAASEEIGRELARAGCRLLVYSADADYIEGDVVRGYCAESADKADGSIHYRHPKSYNGQFAEQGEKSPTERMFVEWRDISHGWEASFYRSLEDAAGILLMGGGASTAIAGHVALVLRKPIAPVAAFGGSGEALYSYVERLRDAPTLDELQAMLTWGPQSAHAVVGSIVRRDREGQRRGAEDQQRIQALEEKVRTYDAAFTTEKAERKATFLLLACGFCLAVVAFAASSASSGSFATPLFVAALAVAGATGAAVQLLRAPLEQRPFRATLLGCAAGVVCSVLYVLPQIAGTGGVTIRPSTGVQFALTLLVAFGAGMAADAVLDAFQKRTAARTPAIVDEALALQAAKPSNGVKKGL